MQKFITINSTVGQSATEDRKCFGLGLAEGVFKTMGISRGRFGEATAESC